MQDVTSLAQLGAWARKNNLERALATPVGDLLDAVDLTTPEATVLDTLIERHALSTVGDLLSPGSDDVVRADRFRRPIASKIAAWLRDQAPSRAPDEPARAAIARAQPTATASAPPAAMSTTKVPAERPAIHGMRFNIPPPPREPVALSAWAETHGVIAALDALGPPYLGMRVYGIVALPAKMRDLVLAMHLLTKIGNRSTSLAANAAWAAGEAATLLVRAAEIAGRQRVYAAWLGAHGGPPTEPALVALASQIREHRAELRPTPSGAPLLASPLELQEEPLCLVYQESEVWTHAHRTVTIFLDRAELRIACSCSNQPGCDNHQARALAATLDLLHEPIPTGTGPSVRRALADAIGAPPWARVLRAIDRRLKAATPTRSAPSEERMAWRVSVDGQTVSLEPLAQRPRKGGGWTKGARPGMDALWRSSWLRKSPLDGPAVRALTQSDSGRYGTPKRREIIEALLALVGHPRVFLAGTQDDVPLAIEPARLGLVLDERDDGVAPRFVVGSNDVPIVDIAALKNEDDDHDDEEMRRLVVLDGKARRLFIVPIDLAAHTVAAALAGQESTPFPPDSYDEIVRRLAELSTSFDLELPPALEGLAVDALVRPVVRLSPLEGTGINVELYARPIVDGPSWLPGEGPTIARHVQNGRRVFTRRDAEAEQRAGEELVASLPLHEADAAGPWCWRVRAEDRAIDLILALKERSDGLVVEWPKEGAIRVTTMSTTLRVRVTERRDWFGLEGSVDVDGDTVTLAALLAAVRSGRRYVALGPGRYAAIAATLRKRLEAAQDVVFDGRNGLEVSPLAADRVSDLVDDPGDFEAVASFRKIASRIDASKTLEPRLPRGLEATLRPYQVEGFKWLARLSSWGAGACLADEMGLGKTLQALTLLLHRKGEGPALVIAPTSVGPNWIREAERFAPGLNARLYRGNARQAMLADLGPGDMIVTSYALATRDEEILKKVRFGTLVLDEAQAIKNAQTRRARAIRGLQAGVRVALTGTPVENHLGELWSLMRILTPGLLGSWEQFRERFAAPIERTRSPARIAALARTVRPFLLRRTKVEVAPELPPRIEVERFVDLCPAERSLYDAARRAAIEAIASPSGEDARFLMLAWLTKLRRLACHPRLFDEHSTAPSSKLAALLEVVAELREGGHRALVFSQFTSHLALVREALDRIGVRYEYLDGSTPSEERTRRIDAFQSGSSDLFLISLKAGGTGLNLTGADYVIHLDPWWNPAVEDQATDRAHRIGQTRAVTVVRLIVRGTIEEMVLTLHTEKRLLAGAIFDAEGAPAKLSMSELAALIRGGVTEAQEDFAGDEEGADLVEDAAPSEPRESAPRRTLRGPLTPVPFRPQRGKGGA